MIGLNYRYEFSPEKNVVKIRPTKGTIAKTYGLSYGLFAIQLLFAAWTFGAFSRKKPDEVAPDTDETQQN